MEANELYNFSISPLVTASFSLEWSEDNHVSLITQRGVDVFEVVPQPMCIYPTLKFWRTFIYPSEFLPTEAFQQFVNGALWKMKRDEMYTLLMQEAITPKINEKTSINPRIIRIVWSPIKLADSSKCLAAIVTSAGSIEILYKLGNNWFSVWNLSDRWSRLVEQKYEIHPVSVTESSFEKFTWEEHMKRLLGTAIDWSRIFRDINEKPFAYLVAAFRSSDLVIARIERLADLAVTKEPCIVYNSCLNTSVKINQLLWISLDDEKRHVILIGYADGRIHGLRISETDGKFNEERLLRYEDRADRMPLTSFKCMKREDENFVILATKSSCLVVLIIDSNGEYLTTRYLRVRGFSITGLTVVSTEKVILTTQDSRIYAVTIRGTEAMSHELVKHDMKSKKVQYLGMARSPNCTILLNVTSPDVMYDHLMIREPSSLQVFRLNGDDWDPWRIINEKLVANVSLREYWDCVESLRINAAMTNEPEKILPVLPSNLDGLNIHKLRVIMWLTLIFQVLTKKQLLKGVDKIVGEISEAQPLIFLTSICEHLARLTMKNRPLNENERCSVSFLRMYMEIYLAGEDEDEINMSDMGRKVTAAFRNSCHVDAIATESCNLCGEILSELPWIVDTCPTGHKLPRCSTSLLQITSVKYRSCPVCDRLFHPSLDDEYDEIRCLYCDVPAQYDSRVSCSLDNVGEQSKNLSKRPASYNQTETMRVTGEMENGNVTANDKVRRRPVNPHTFAVIVNRDQDDDSLITETWQEF